MIDEKLIVVGGGVGPMAGLELHKKIITNTQIQGKDQDHLQVWHLSRSYDITDRTGFLSGQTNINPAEGMARTFILAAKCLEIENRAAVGGITCNTFHAPEIFNRFLDILKKAKVEIEILNMIEETSKFLKKNYSGFKKIGLMSTTGTRKALIYQKILEPLGFDIVQIDENKQDALHDAIYNPVWGIKAATPITENARNSFLGFAKEISEKDVDAIILGCTEIPLALPEEKFNNIPLIDPVLILARELIKNANPNKLKKTDFKNCSTTILEGA